MIILSLLILKNLLNINNDNKNFKNIELKYFEKTYFCKGGNFIYNTIIAILVSLHSRNKIKISRKDYNTRSGDIKTSYEIEKIDLSGLDAAEKKIVDILFSFSNEDKISTRNLNKLRKNAPDDYNKPFNEFIYFLEDRMKSYGLITKKKTSNRSVIAFVVFSLLFLIGSITVYNGHIFGAVSIILSIILYGFLIASFSKMTTSGKNKFRELEKLENDLKDLKLNTCDATLVSIGFGLNFKNIRDIYEISDEVNMDIFFEDKDIFYKVFKEALVGNYLLTRN